MTAILAVLLSAAVVHIVVCNKYRPEGTKISDYDNYLEDTSIIGKEISCTEQEKACYKFRRVLHTDGKCYMLSHAAVCKDSGLSFNKEKAKNGEYKPECQPTFKCGTINEMFMAYDQTCYRATLINDVCDYKKNLSASQNVFGETHCRCFGSSCPPRPVVIQPEEVGKCRLPDLMHETFPYWSDPLAYRLFPCTDEEHTCFTQMRMLHEESGKCYQLLEQGPCADGEIFMANQTAFKERGWLIAMCAPPPCPRGQIRMQIDGQCIAEEDARNKICPPHILVRDVFKNYNCGFKQDLDVGKQLPRGRTSKGECMGQYRHF